MDDAHDSCSMTPPLSPVMGEVLQDDNPNLMESPPKRICQEEFDPDNPICFACLGEVDPGKNVQTHAQSLLQTGYLDRLFSGKSNSRMTECLTVGLFGHQFVCQLALDENMDTLFYLAEQHIDRVVSAATGLGANANEALHYRQEMQQFFGYIRSYILWYSSSRERSDRFLGRLLTRVKSLLLHVGSLHQLPTHIIGTCASRLGNQSLLASYHTFHLHLEVQSSFIEILHIISTKFPDWNSNLDLFETGSEHLNQGDMFNQCLRLLLWDIILLAMATHAKMSVNDYPHRSPFSCACVKELCVMLVHLLNHRQQKMARQSFWVSLYPVLQTVLMSTELDHHQQATDSQDLDCDKFAMPPPFQCADPIGFCWWLLLHIAPLYQYDLYGIPKTAKLTEAGQSNYNAVLDLLKTMLGNKHALTESQLRCRLQCCLRLSSLWGPNTDVVATLWEYFYRRLNSHFRQPGAGLEGYASISKSAAGWLDQCKERCQSDSHRLDNDSSYQLFLRILATHLTAEGSTGRANTTWKQLKGRFYTKFHTRRMQELTDIGLYNFTSLFLVLAMIADSEDVGGKLCELFKALGSLDSARRETVWKGLFALALYQVEQCKDVAHPADHLVEGFNNICGELSSPGLDPSRYAELSPLVNLYLDSTQEVIETSTSLALSEYRLIGGGIKELLKTCRDNEMRGLLGFTQAILAKHRLVTRRLLQDGLSSTATLQHRHLSDALWRFVYEFVKQHACTQTPCHQVADVAAGFTLLVMDSPPSIQTGMKEDFQHCFQYFGWAEHVNARVSCRFLCHLLTNQSAIERLSVDVTNHEAVLIAAWFRCAWTVALDDPQMIQLTRLMIKLEEMKSIFVESDIQPGDSPGSVLSTFIQSLGHKYGHLQDLREKVAFQQHVQVLLGDVSKQVTSSKLASSQPEILQAMYNVGGLLVKHCGNFLYIKSRPDCVLPMLIERLILPRMLLTPNKPVPGPILTAIREHLYLFVQGLGCLDYRRDPYIQRKLRDVVIQYLPRFSERTFSTSNVTSVHPLLTAMSETCGRQVSEESVQFRHHVLQVVQTEFLTLRGVTVHGHASLALGFLMDLSRKTLNSDIIARGSEVVLECLLTLLLLCENPSIKVLATNNVQTILEACARLPADSAVIDRVAHGLEQFLTRHLGAHQARVLRVLETASVLCPTPLIQLIPVLTAAVRSTEAKRGTGVDKQLRVAYFSVLDNLGDKGRAEKSSLLVSNTG